MWFIYNHNYLNLFSFLTQFHLETCSSNWRGMWIILPVERLYHVRFGHEIELSSWNVLYYPCAKPTGMIVCVYFREMSNLTLLSALYSFYHNELWFCYNKGSFQQHKHNLGYWTQIIRVKRPELWSKSRIKENRVWYRKERPIIQFIHESYLVYSKSLKMVSFREK